MLFAYLILLAVIAVVAVIVTPLVVAGYALARIWVCGRAYLASFAQALGIPEAEHRSSATATAPATER